MRRTDWHIERFSGATLIYEPCRLCGLRVWLYARHQAAGEIHRQTGSITEILLVATVITRKRHVIMISDTIRSMHKPHDSISKKFNDHAETFAEFVPHPWLKSPHAQTVAAAYLPGARYPYRARQHRVQVDAEDRIVLHDDCPSEWSAGNRVALLIHGLAGCHLSSYMVRVSARLTVRGLRAFRMDLRGSGAGMALARRPFHAGRTADLREALGYIRRTCPGSPITLVGFSIGGNLALKLLGETDAGMPEGL